ncbi:MAG: hypothetical protein IPN73_01325 [Saprospiraceae bacterium]|nr:hypothetical protein [Saprospiraceae bacterium]
MSIHSNDRSINKYIRSAQNDELITKIPFARPRNINEGIDNSNIKDKIIKEFRENFRLTEGILVIIVALISGYLAKKKFIGHSNNPVKRFFGEMLLIGITSFVANHQDEIKKVHNTLTLWVQKMRGEKSNENRKNLS